MSFATKSARNLLAILGVLAFGAAAASAQTALPSASPALTPTPVPSESPPSGPSALAAQPSLFSLAIGAEQQVKILGATGNLTAQISPPIAQIAIDQTTHVVHVVGQQVGNGTLVVTDQSGAVVNVSVRVAPPAGTIPASVSLTVTGTPAGPRFLERQIDAALDRAIRPTLAPGAAVQYGPLPIALQPLQPGFITSLTMPVTIAATQDYADVSGSTTVNVTSMALAPLTPTLLFFDDDPEHVGGLGTLFRGTVDASKPARLYYYHDDLGLPKNIAVVLTSNSGIPSRVHLVDAAAGPDLDVMSVGHAVTKTFLLNEPRNEGIVADILPAAPFILHQTLTLAGELVAGAVDVRVLMGGPVTVTVVAFPAGDKPSAYIGVDDLARDTHQRHGVFDITGFGTQTIPYAVGGPDASYVYGTRDQSPPNVNPDDRGHDLGDYGVVHHITFDITNPNNNAQNIYLYEKPLGGPVRSTFIVDGRVVELGCVRVPEHYLIASYQMPAQGHAASTIVTMADGGSNYPLEIGITTTQPIPATPPQNAPDGCFPKPAAFPSPSAAPSVLPTPFEQTSPEATPTPEGTSF